MAESFSYKITTESELFTFDFSQVLSPSETISTANCAVIVMNGVDNNPNNIIVGSAVISGQTASQRIANGVNDVTYRLSMTVTTSQGNTYVGVGDLNIYTVPNV
jgi:hypothetical protein